MGVSPSTSLQEARRASPSMRATMRHRRFAIVASQFNPSISRALVRGATETLRRAGVAHRNVRLYWVPGAFELPVVVAKLAHASRRPHAIIAVGALIRGQTPQYEILAHAVAQSLSQVAITTRIPVTFGVIVATTVAQATARAGGTRGNRGVEAARAALDVVRLSEVV